MPQTAYSFCPPPATSTEQQAVMDSSLWTAGAAASNPSADSRRQGMPQGYRLKGSGPICLHQSYALPSSHSLAAIFAATWTGTLMHSPPPEEPCPPSLPPLLVCSTCRVQLHKFSRILGCLKCLIHLSLSFITALSG